MTFGKAGWTFFLSVKKQNLFLFPLLKLVMFYYYYAEIVENMQEKAMYTKLSRFTHLP